MGTLSDKIDEIADRKLSDLTLKDIFDFVFLLALVLVPICAATWAAIYYVIPFLYDVIGDWGAPYLTGIFGEWAKPVAFGVPAFFALGGLGCLWERYEEWKWNREGEHERVMEELEAEYRRQYRLNWSAMRKGTPPPYPDCPGNWQSAETLDYS